MLRSVLRDACHFLLLQGRGKRDLRCCGDEGRIIEGGVVNILVGRTVVVDAKRRRQWCDL